jgi:RimJ/RimL family protein N-acetyltransferase
MDLHLRDVAEEDLPIFFTYQLDPEACRMAAFTSKDPTDEAAFRRHWSVILADPTIVNKTVVVEERVVGQVSSFVEGGEREVCYWIDRAEWGRGYATEALRLLLGEVTERPIHARAAQDNLASIRVLEKCGFTVSGHDSGFANARGEIIDEVLFTL